QILLKSMIAEVGEKNVREEVVAETCYFVSQEAAQNFLGMILSPNSLTVPVSVTAVLRSAAKKKSQIW
ncbi:130_t:CDS:2, partial [Cetraspora pellucida]